MSRFVVSTDLIDLLATAARRIRNGRMHNGFFDYDDATPTSTLATALFELNYKVVVADDYEEEETEKPEYTFQPVAEILDGPLKPRHLVQIYQSANSYIYQTGEDHPDWAYGLAWATVKAVRFWAEKSLHELNWAIVKRTDVNGVDWAGVEGTAWDWTREHGFPELTFGAARLDDDELRSAIKGGEDSLRGVGPWLTSTRASLLARIILADHPDAVSIVLEQEDGRVVGAAVYGEAGGRLAEIIPVPQEGAEPAAGDEASRLLAMIDAGESNPLWTQFPRIAGGAATPRAFDLVAAAAWSPLARHSRPSE